MEEANLNNSKHLFKIKSSEGDEEFRLFGRPCELSAHSFVPENRAGEPARRNIYNFKSDRHETDSNLDYDRMFTNVNYDYDNKVHRCDRRHAKLHGLDAWREECTKQVPTKSSHEYGKRLINLDRTTNTSITEGMLKFNYNVDLLDPPERKHVRVAKVKSEFYNRNGINDLSKEREIL